MPMSHQLPIRQAKALAMSVSSTKLAGSWIVRLVQLTSIGLPPGPPILHTLAALCPTTACGAGHNPRNAWILAPAGGNQSPEKRCE